MTITLDYDGTPVTLQIEDREAKVFAHNAYQGTIELTDDVLEAIWHND